MHMESGMGPGPDFYRQYEDLFSAEIGLAKKKYDLTNPVVDTAALQKKHIRCKWKMWFSDSADQKKKAFIDLTEGTVFVTGGAKTDKVSSFPGAKINFKEVLANPAATVTLKISDKDLTMSNLESLTLFLTIVRNEFKLGPDFVDDMLYLTSHLKEYSENILLGPINAVRETWDIKAQALRKKKEVTDRPGSSSHKSELDAAELILEEAADEIQAGDSVSATQKYQDALKAFTDLLALMGPP